MIRLRFGVRARAASDGRFYYLEHWLPALILIFVASLQLYLTYTTNLSPWKGGGFGMFATIDAPATRVIMAEGLDQEGHLLRLDVSSALNVNTVRRIRALPRQTDLEQIAPQLVSQLVVPTIIQRQAAYEKLLLDSPELQSVSELDRAILLTPQPSLSPSIQSLSQPLYRLKTAYDPTLPKVVKTLKAVRLQWWRIRFDRDRHRLWAEPLSEVVEAGTWP